MEPVAQSLFTLYESGKWVLIPEEHIVDHFLATPGPVIPLFSSLEHEAFYYTFLPLANLSSFGIPHCNQADPRAHSAQTYSLLTQRPVMLHLHPKVMMLRISRLLYERPRDPYLLQLKKSHPVVRKLDNLYPLWPTTPSPQRASSDRPVAVIKEGPKTNEVALFPAVPPRETSPSTTMQGQTGTMHIRTRTGWSMAHIRRSTMSLSIRNSPHRVTLSPVSGLVDGYARNGHEGFVDSNVPIATGSTWTREAIASWARDCSNSPPPPDAVTFPEELEDSTECSILPSISKFARLSGFKPATERSICNS
ncbi:hypothetical protein D9611_011673 [Ephemerocybe angulata]|uniref:Uncharacterized protein n=1 Tax=Ephemerocybe angulata TaxID=980116 RepID=A0A8H5C4X7_9AGAR|nr:hypothetical protein D9611_011673 [Tulosesus angulatus]